MPSWPIRLTPEPEKVGDALRRIREADPRGLDQEAVAQAVLHKKAGTLGDLERSKRPPTRAECVAFEAFFQLEPGTLWDIYTHHRDWLEAQEPLPGEALAVPYRESLEDLVARVLKWPDRAIYALLKQADEMGADTDTGHRDYDDKDWDGHKRKTG